MAPFCHLLSQSTTFEWNEDLETAFKRSKEKIVELIKEGVAAFVMNLVTWTTARRGWAGAEGEATAVARGLQDTKYYTMECKNLYIATDQASLVIVLGDRSLADVENPRLARIKEQTLWWQFKIIHTPGKLQLAADALSRRKSKLPANLYRLSAADSDVGEEEVIADLRLRQNFTTARLRSTQL